MARIGVLVAQGQRGHSQRRAAHSSSLAKSCWSPPPTGLRVAISWDASTKIGHKSRFNAVSGEM